MRTTLITLSTLAALAFVPITARADDTAQPKAENPPQQPEPQKEAKDSGYVVPQAVPYQGGKIPVGASIESRPNYTLIATGLSIAGAAYAASVITSIAACPPQSTCSSTSGAGWLYLPLVGPFITAAQKDASVGGAALAAFDGGVQILGAALAVAGVFAPKKFVIWQDKSASIKITPTVGGEPATGDARPAMSAGVSFTLTHM